MERRAPAAWKLGLLSLLYFVQGLPFGFQSKGLKLLLADDKTIPMTAVTLLGCSRCRGASSRSGRRSSIATARSASAAASRGSCH